MGCLYATELWEGRTGQESFDRHRTYTRVFEVRTSSPLDDVVVVGSYPILPRLGESHPNDLAAVVVTIRPDQSSDDPTLWRVSIEYDTKPPFPEAKEPDDTENEPKDKPESPDIRPPVWSVSFQQTEQAVRYAQGFNADGTPGFAVDVKNSAKLPYDPPVMIEVSRPVIKVTYNKIRFDLSKAQDLQDAVNLKTWQKIQPRCARCIGLEANSKFENGIAFWEVSYSFALKYDTWDIRALDAGYAELISRTGFPDTYVKIRDPFGNEATEPVPLNGLGRRLQPGQPFVYNVFRIYRERDFAKLLK